METKALRLRDILNYISSDETVSIIFNHGKSVYTENCKNILQKFNGWIDKEIISISAKDGKIVVYM